jgi:hypothetical protein
MRQMAAEVAAVGAGDNAAAGAVVRAHLEAGSGAVADVLGADLDGTVRGVGRCAHDIPDMTYD